MSAIELMDPKMDAGMVRTKKPLGFCGAVKAGKLQLDGLSIDDQMRMIDATWACYVTWLEGHSLVQTLFTNLYLHDPMAVIDKVVQVFALGMLKLIALTKDIVCRAWVSEEEDFQPTVFSFSLAPQAETSKVHGMMKDVEEDLHKTIRVCALLALNFLK